MPISFCREPLEPGLKLAATLRHLAAGSTYADMQYAWRVPANTLSVIIREVCNAIIEEYTDELMTPPCDSDEWKAIADHFMQRWHFPHCCGALDGKHIAIKKPAHSGSLYHNYKGYFSIILLALVDADYKFIWADVGGKTLYIFWIFSLKNVYISFSAANFKTYSNCGK